VGAVPQLLPEPQRDHRPKASPPDPVHPMKSPRLTPRPCHWQLCDSLSSSLRRRASGESSSTLWKPSPACHFSGPRRVVGEWHLLPRQSLVHPSGATVFVHLQILQGLTTTATPAWELTHWLLLPSGMFSPNALTCLRSAEGSLCSAGFSSRTAT
jgi:hypothetical protein